MLILKGVLGAGGGGSSDQQWHNCGAVTAALCGHAAPRCGSILWLCQQIHPPLCLQPLFSLYPHPLLLRPSVTNKVEPSTSLDKTKFILTAPKFFHSFQTQSVLCIHSRLPTNGLFQQTCHFRTLATSWEQHTLYRYRLVKGMTCVYALSLHSLFSYHGSFTSNPCVANTAY